MITSLKVTERQKMDFPSKNGKMSTTGSELSPAGISYVSGTIISRFVWESTANASKKGAR